MENVNIQREGELTGRFAAYTLIVNGVSLGRVKRVSVGDGGVLLARTRRSGWKVQGLISTQEEVEQFLIDSAIRVGTLVVKP